MFGGMKIPPKQVNGTKSELKLGHIVKLRDGTIGKIAQNGVNCQSLYIDQPISQGIIWLSDYSEGLRATLYDFWDACDKKTPEYDIIAIYEEGCIGNFLEFIKSNKTFDEQYFNKVWERNGE